MNFSAWFGKNLPFILTGVGIGCAGAAMVVAFNNGKEAQMDILEAEQKKGEKLTVKEEIAIDIPYLITPGILAFTSSYCITRGSKILLDRGTAATVAYMAADAALKETREKTKELIGKKKETDVNDAIAKDAIKALPYNSNEVIITSNGDTLCLDKISGRYFKSDIERLKKIENVLNRRMIDTTFISLNEYYLEVGLSPVILGDELGWDIGRGLIEMRFSAQLTDNGEPCMVVDFDIGPKHY